MYSSNILSCVETFLKKKTKMFNGYTLENKTKKCDT